MMLLRTHRVVAGPSVVRWVMWLHAPRDVAMATVTSALTSPHAFRPHLLARLIVGVDSPYRAALAARFATSPVFEPPLERESLLACLLQTEQFELFEQLVPPGSHCVFPNGVSSYLSERGFVAVHFTPTAMQYALRSPRIGDGFLSRLLIFARDGAMIRAILSAPHRTVDPSALQHALKSARSSRDKTREAALLLRDVDE